MNLLNVSETKVYLLLILNLQVLVCRDKKACVNGAYNSQKAFYRTCVCTMWLLSQG